MTPGGFLPVAAYDGPSAGRIQEPVRDRSVKSDGAGVMAALVSAIRHLSECMSSSSGASATSRRPEKPGASSLASGNYRQSLSAAGALALAGFLFAIPAHAGGLDDVAEAPDPCPAGVVLSDPSMTGAMLAQWSAVRGMSCPEAPRAFFDRATGERLTDAEILRRVFNGSRVEPVAPIPLPSGGWALVAGLAALVAMRRRAA